MSLSARPRRYIRVARVPPGEAPFWVREKWVGLELPLVAGERGARRTYAGGVLSGPHNPFVAIVMHLIGRLKREAGYMVDAIEAVNILERTAPDAARWWRQNAQALLLGRRKFLFQEAVCDLLPEGAG
jgi:hypothetical protein